MDLPTPESMRDPPDRRTCRSESESGGETFIIHLCKTELWFSAPPPSRSLRLLLSRAWRCTLALPDPEVPAQRHARRWPRELRLQRWVCVCVRTLTVPKLVVFPEMTEKGGASFLGTALLFQSSAFRQSDSRRANNSRRCRWIASSMLVWRTTWLLLSNRTDPGKISSEITAGGRTRRSLEKIT